MTRIRHMTTKVSGMIRENFSRLNSTLHKTMTISFTQQVNRARCQRIAYLNMLLTSSKFLALIYSLIRPIPRSDDYRLVGNVAKDGGFNLDDAVLLAKYRNAFKDLLGQVGRMLLSGKFELYKVSFPIKAMSPKSILYAVSKQAIHSPVFLNAAALT
jgi:hypothetical protein